MKKYSHWTKLSHEEIKQKIFTALEKNVHYTKETILGIPASHLDERVFSQNESFLANAPYISTLVHNPNHIGCHTMGTSEPFFQGTQAIEKQTIDLCATDILGAEQNTCDGYIASGGTEANIQAIWMYRNLYAEKYLAAPEDIFLLSSTDSHYSMAKAANLLGISHYQVDVETETRSITNSSVNKAITKALNEGKKYAIVVANMMTTMFGSVDNAGTYTEVLRKLKVTFHLHLDGAYGGFYYPFSTDDSSHSFANEDVSSVTLDAHKMAQAPYGTGIFLARKGLIAYTNTKAGYVAGDDYTLIGSRSGANAVAVWMILMTHGPFGWQEKIYVLQKRTDWMCDQLTARGVEHYRHRGSNVITMKAKHITPATAAKFGLVADNHTTPNWYKIVVMDHVTVDKLMLVLEDVCAVV